MGPDEPLPIKHFIIRGSILTSIHPKQRDRMTCSFCQLNLAFSVLSDSILPLFSRYFFQFREICNLYASEDFMAYESYMQHKQFIQMNTELGFHLAKGHCGADP